MSGPTDADNAVNVLEAVEHRRRWVDHWYRPGPDTPLGYYLARFAFLGLLVAGLPEAVAGHGWHYTSAAWFVVAVDGSWHAKLLLRKLRR